ncbi:hypothetical protein WH95_10115 [Kiloniella litopenaei]|uniref:ABC transporter ATP-binding protein n=1 Tax=Kiloniella litopenaei TaxID=1549748 RepID=A0A0M2RAJ2_9PROT|nr:ABC transporter ATP-binding protein [Kiloniella litopenaei]KKJ77010.1 hypothetical protein WH95_10115 [Kiloniella litopenaei]
MSQATSLLVVGKKLIRGLLDHFPIRTPILLSVMVLAGVTEGLTMALVLPLLNLLGLGGTGTETSLLEKALSKSFDYLGLSPDLPTILTLFVTIVIAQAAIYICQGWISANVQNALVKEWRLKLLRACLHARWGFIASNRSGDFVNAIVMEVFRAGGAFYLIFQFIAGLIVTCVYIGLSLMASPLTTLSLIAGGLVAVFSTRWIVVRARVIGQESVAQNEKITTFVGEIFSGMKTIKAYASERDVYNRVEQDSEELRRLSTINSFDPYLIRATFEGFGIILFAGLFVAGAGTLNIPLELILLVIAAFIRLYPRIMQMQQHLQTMNSIFPAVGKVLELTQSAEAASQYIRPEQHKVTNNIAADISFEALHINYGDHKVIQGLDLRIPSRQMTAIIGPSGSGKTTLIDCILGLTDPHSGKVLIGEHPLENLDLPSWRQQVGYVGQETFLFNATIRDNLRFGNPEASDEEIQKAARAANAEDFILKLPGGYDAAVGDRGVRLSGGQRQRLGLARALVGDKMLLILDEATSALDSESEKRVLEAISRLHGHITVISIAHRISTVRNADKICVVEEGRLIESGTWDELKEHKGRFYEFLRHQHHDTEQQDADVVSARIEGANHLQERKDVENSEELKQK